ncbi:hypothetical protein UY3_06847 [Chelonia mydas]|uniref:Secreted protein n=1 Tax=Chelonia mydas TaxID=8469 RepID=M7BFK1_CHEMY|nr:hypothetical protein UY3_06847 [Chelonia mydas]
MPIIANNLKALIRLVVFIFSNGSTAARVFSLSRNTETEENGVQQFQSFAPKDPDTPEEFPMPQERFRFPAASQGKALKHDSEVSKTACIWTNQPEWPIGQSSEVHSDPEMAHLERTIA